MKSALFRLLLACLLSIAIPVQGFAALGSSRNAPCGMSAMEMSMMADEMPTPAAMPDGTSDSPHRSACPHCASHCASMNLATFPSPPPLAIYERGMQTGFPPLVQSLPNAPVHLPERPPKA